MSESLLVNVTPMETRVVLLEQGLVQEVHIERPVSRGIVGNIYAGKIVRVLPGMQAAFVDIGAARTAFLHVSELGIIDTASGKKTKLSALNVADYLHQGQKIIVQVIRDPLGDKGALLTTQLSVSTRYLVLMPDTQHIGISQLIAGGDERQRLRQVLREELDKQQMDDFRGFILRTAAEGASSQEIAADLRYLQRLWTTISRRGKAAQAATLLYEDLPLHLRLVRDLVRPSIERILIDSEAAFHALREFCEEFVPEVSGMLQHHEATQLLFDEFQVEAQLTAALNPRVALESGGYLVIDQTEAMSTVDVNTGSFVGGHNQAETILKTNLEAVTALVRQLRLRNLGGIIIIDFIDMLSQQHRQQVHDALRVALTGDSARNQITGVSELGLVEMTRKRTRESLEHLLCEECSVCEGRGMLKTAQSVCYEIFRKILRDAGGAPAVGDGLDDGLGDGLGEGLMVCAAPGVVDRLKVQESAHLVDLEGFIGKTITLQAQAGYSQEHFDIILL